MTKRYYLMKDGRKIKSFKPTENLDLYLNSGNLILTIKPLNMKVNLGVVEKIDYDFKSKEDKKENVRENRKDLETLLYLFYKMIGE